MKHIIKKAVIRSSPTGFVKGFTLFFRAGGTWWIPLLLVFGAWGYSYKRYPLRHDPLHWGPDMPLDAHTVCTFRPALQSSRAERGFLLASEATAVVYEVVVNRSR